jgi:hypothetical protein
MVSCHDLKVGDILYCEDCGLEFKVLKTCEECETDAESCGCDDHCSFSCCGEELKIK